MEVTRQVVESMKNDWNAGVTQAQIAKKYSNLGYRTSRGNALSQYFVCDALKRVAKATTGIHPVAPVTAAKKITTPNTKAAFIANVVSCADLTIEDKTKVIVALIG
jgi:hypothetical protein